MIVFLHGSTFGWLAVLAPRRQLPHHIIFISPNRHLHSALARHNFLHEAFNAASCASLHAGVRLQKKRSSTL